MKAIEWIFFDIGSTLADESKVYERRFKKIAELADVSEEYVLKKAVEYCKNNQKGDLAVIKLLGVEKPVWEHKYEILYKDTETCLKDLSQKYKIGIIANQEFGTEKRLIEFGIRKYIDVIVGTHNLSELPSMIINANNSHKQDIEVFIQNIIHNIDPLKEQRTKFVNEVLMPKGSPSQNIIDDILDSIDNQILYRN